MNIGVLQDKLREAWAKLQDLPKKAWQQTMVNTRLWVATRRQAASLRVARRQSKKAASERGFEFPAVNAQKYEIKAQEAGQGDAISSVPNPKSVILPPAIVSIQNELKSIYNQGIKSCQALFEDIETRVDNFVMRFSGVTLEAQANQVRDEMSVALTFSPHAESINFHYKEFVRRHADLQRFRVQHDLAFEPIRGGKGTGSHVAFIAAIYLIESFFNASLFINVTGLLGGLTISLSASAINIIFGYLVGRFLVPAIFFHPNWQIKILALFGTSAFLAFIVYLNFAIAVFRSLSENAQNSFEAVNTGLAIDPFSNLSVLSFESALVVAVGMLFATAALLDGYFSDDPFPGYGAKWRACIKERNIIQHEFKEYQKQFDTATRFAREETQTTFNEAQQAIYEWSKEINKVQHYFVDFEQWADKINDAANASWEIYVSTHENYRNENYMPPKSLTTRPQNLLDDDQVDPLYVFAGAANCYMDDEERQKKAAGFEADFLKKHSQAEQDLEKTIIVLTNTLAELEVIAQCNI